MDGVPSTEDCELAAKVLQDWVKTYRPDGDGDGVLNVAGFLILLAPQIPMLTAMLPPA